MKQFLQSTGIIKTNQLKVIYDYKKRHNTKKIALKLILAAKWVKKDNGYGYLIQIDQTKHLQKDHCIWKVPSFTQNVTPNTSYLSTVISYK